MKMNKEELIKKLNEGMEVVLEGNFDDGEVTWNYEYWQKNDDGKYQCSYDGECSHYFNYEDLDMSFTPEEAEDIEIK